MTSFGRRGTSSPPSPRTLSTNSSSPSVFLLDSSKAMMTSAYFAYSLIMSSSFSIISSFVSACIIRSCRLLGVFPLLFFETLITPSALDFTTISTRPSGRYTSYTIPASVILFTRGVNEDAIILSIGLFFPVYSYFFIQSLSGTVFLNSLNVKSRTTGESGLAFPSLTYKS